VISPDGRHLAFLARDDGSRQVQLWIRALDSSDARMLPGTAGAMRPFWAPDSQAVGFFAAGRLKAVPVGGGPAREIAAIKVDPSGASWGAGGTIIFADRVFGLFRVPAAGGEPQPLGERGTLPRELAYRWPAFLPDGQRYLYDVVSADANVSGVYLGDVGSAQRMRVLDGSYSAALYAAPGYVLALREGTLVAQAVDPATLAPRGTPAPLVSNVSPPGPLDNAVASVSTDGLLAVGGATTPDVLSWFDRAGARVDTVKLPVALVNPTLVLRHPHQLLGTMNNDTQRGGVWFVDLQRGAATRLIERAGGAAIVSPEGDRIAFASTESGFRDVYVRTTTAGQDELLVNSHEPKRLDHWSDDGRFVVYVSSNTETQQDLWVVRVADRRSASPYLVTRANEMHGRISPDGRWMAYTSDETGTWEVYVDSFPTPSLKRTVSVGGGAQPQWRADGGELFYLRPDRTIMAVSVRRSLTGVELGAPQPLFRAPIGAELTSGRNHYVAAPDGRRFLVRSASESAGRQPIRVIVNWAALLATGDQR
jgi:Tol biopolymer transport system component